MLYIKLFIEREKNIGQSAPECPFKLSGLVLGRRPLGAILHSSNETGELSQWLCHDDNTINIVVVIIIIIIINQFVHVPRVPTSVDTQHFIQIHARVSE